MKMHVRAMVFFLHVVSFQKDDQADVDAVTRFTESRSGDFTHSSLSTNRSHSSERFLLAKRISYSIEYDNVLRFDS